eukprot:g2175.t1
MLASARNLGILTNLVKLDLSHNEIVGEFALHELHSVAQVDLRNNRIAELSPLKGALTRLAELRLSANRLAALPVTFGKGMPALRTLCLAGNDLVELPETFSMLTGLQGELDLSRNRFTERFSFPTSMPGLRHVRMSGCPLKVEGLSAAKHVQMGDLKARDGDVQAAIAHYTDALEVDPVFFEAIQKRFKMFKLAQLRERGIEDLTRAIDIRFDDASLFTERGLLYLELIPVPKSENALLDFRAAQERNAQLWPAVVGEARALLQIGNLKAAAAACRRAILANPVEEVLAEAKFFLGMSHFKQGDVLYCLKLCNQLLGEDADDDNDDSDGGGGDGVGKEDPILLRRVLALPEKKIEVTLMRGMCHRDLQKWKEALDDFSFIIENAKAHSASTVKEPITVEERMQHRKEEIAELVHEVEEEEALIEGKQQDPLLTPRSSANNSEKEDGEITEDEEDSEVNSVRNEGEGEGEGEGEDEGEDEDEDDEEDDEPPLHVPAAMLESAYLNRAAVFSSMGMSRDADRDFEQVFERPTDAKVVEAARAKREEDERAAAIRREELQKATRERMLKMEKELALAREEAAQEAKRRKKKKNRSKKKK